MQPRQVVRVLAAGLPALLLALAGLAHPMNLTDASAGRWVTLHVVLLPLFPLLGLGPWLVAREWSVPAGRVVAALGYVYAICYTGLDVLAGIGAGELQRHGDSGHKQLLYDPGNALAWYGVLAYLAATVITVVTVGAGLRHAGRGPLVALAPGAVLVVVAAVSFLSSHVYWPRGVLTMLALAAGWALLARFVRPPSQAGAGQAGAGEPGAGQIGAGQAR